ncbi:MAG: hypothetical protein WDW38_005325 [Sanguina aurantia]
MAGQAVSDPLRFASAYDEDMEDLTAQLERDVHSYDRRSSDDGLGMSASSPPMYTGNLDRYKALVGREHSGRRSGGGGSSGDGSSQPLPTHTSSQPGYVTYGQLGASMMSSSQPPPSYEDSILFDTVVGVGPGDGGQTPDGGPLGGGSPSNGSHLGGAHTMYGSVTNGRVLGAQLYGGGSSSSASVPPSSTAGAAGAAAHGGPPAWSRSITDGGLADGQGGAGPASSAVPAQATPHTLQVMVSQPLKREQTGIFGIKGGYVTYLVTSMSSQASYNRQNYSVRRRFRDFVALADALKAHYRGYFVAPRPEKNAVEGQRMADGFVEDRRLALERYLNRLARHPVLLQSEEVRVFLQCEGDLEGSSAWASLQPPPSHGVLEGTARFSKQLLGIDRSVTDPVQVRAQAGAGWGPVAPGHRTRLRSVLPRAPAVRAATTGAQRPTHEEQMRPASVRCPLPVGSRCEEGTRVGAQGPDSQGAAEPTSKSGDLMRRLKETRQSLHAGVLDEAELALRKAKDGWEERRELMASASRASAASSLEVIGSGDWVGEAEGSQGADGGGVRSGEAPVSLDRRSP